MIRLLALHDSKGRIHGLVAAPADTPLGTMSADGLSVSEVEAPDRELDLLDPATAERLAELMTRHRVDVRSKRLLAQPAHGTTEQT